MQHPEFARYLSPTGKPQSEMDAWRGLANLIGAWTLNGFSMWAVEEKASGALVGRVGPWQPRGWPGFEIGWGIWPEYQGRGFATEAAAASMVWAHEALGKHSALHLIAPANRPSQKVAERLGATIVGTWDPPWEGDVDLWETRWGTFTQTEAYRRLGR
jgi:RimJ/RimL family protein N-acetyltransferase